MTEKANRPRLPIPAPICGAEPNSWAQSTITVRFTEIARRTMAENDFPLQTVAQLERLLQEIPAGPLRPLNDRAAPDAAAWDDYLEPYAGMNWLEVPWFLAEHYFYRRILEATGYFSNGAGQGRDPFARAKRDGLQQSLANLSAWMTQLEHWRADLPAGERLTRLLYMDLWGNQADYSLWPADGEENPNHTDATAAADYLLSDAVPAIATHLQAGKGKDSCVGLVMDNAGAELIFDLALADELLSGGIAARVRLYLKAHPTFVSDAIPADVQATIAALQRAAVPQARHLGERLQAYQEAERLQLHTHFFWNSPLEGWKMPADLRRELSAAHLVISKGDANYRRWLGDRHWPNTAPFGDVMAYFPAPFAALRTLKAELVCGLAPGAAERADRHDPHWMVNGRWAVAQFSLTPESTSRSPEPA